MPVPPAPECESTPTGSFVCQLVDLACRVNADCPSGLDCIERPVTIECDEATPPNCRALREDPSRVCRPRHRGGSTPLPDAGAPPTGDDGTSPPGEVPAEPDGDAGVDPEPTDGGDVEPTPDDAGPGPDGGTDAGPLPSDGGTDAGPPPSDGGTDAAAPPSDGGVDPEEPTSPEDEARERFRRWLERIFGRGGRGCSLAGQAGGQGADVSFLLLTVALIGLATRRRG